MSDAYTIIKPMPTLYIVHFFIIVFNLKPMLDQSKQRRKNLQKYLIKYHTGLQEQYCIMKYMYFLYNIICTSSTCNKIKINLHSETISDFVYYRS